VGRPGREMLLLLLAARCLALRRICGPAPSHFCRWRRRFHKIGGDDGRWGLTMRTEQLNNHLAWLPSKECDLED
jgi:hypothetical protein